MDKRFFADDCIVLDGRMDEAVWNEVPTYTDFRHFKTYGGELQKELMRYGISSISLHCTGSDQEGIRVCVSMLNNDETFAALNDRLKAFNADH